MNFLKPMLLTCLKSYDRSQFIKDMTAGIIVAIIALPLSIALALASGVGPEAGIFTAIVAGFVISALGGSCVQIAGPLFFGAADAIEHIVVKDFTKCLVLRMRSVPALDSTAMNALQNLVKICENKGITLVFSHVNEQPMRVMKKAGFVELVGEENFRPNISAALKRAEEVI